MPRNLNLINVMDIEDATLRLTSSRTHSDENNVGGECRQAETRLNEPRQLECRQAENRQVDLRPVETRQVDCRPIETRQVDFRAVETRQVDCRPVETRQIDFRPVETRQVECRPVETRQVECRPVEPRQVECRQAEVQQSEPKLLKSLCPPEVPTSPPTLPLTVDQPQCVCSYSDEGGAGEEGGGAEGAAGAGDEDYRRECENCNAANSSRWVVPAEWAARPGEAGSLTAQRRAPAAPACPHTHTLPLPLQHHSRLLMGPPSNWENWFNTIPDSDTESEE